MAAMERTHLKQLRRHKGLTAEELADLIGISQGHMSRIENGQRGLSVAIAEAIAEQLDVDVPTVLGIHKRQAEPAPTTLHEDAEPYTSEDSDLPVQPRRHHNIDPWRVKSNVLDRMGITRNDVAFVNSSADAVEKLAPLQAVVAQIYDPHDLTKARTILRQFVPPSLLITNSSGSNEMPIDMERADVAIKGVVVSVHRALAG